MRSSIFALIVLTSFLGGNAQEENPVPSPTESVGCEPHGDHWHCDGPVSTPPVEVTSIPTPAISSTHDHDHDEHLTETSAIPSPTESVGCEPHGDHWHCDGSASAIAVPTTGTSTDEDEHLAETPTAPSPTESVGCEPHGDHWHCDGPASATATATGFETRTTATDTGSATTSAAAEATGAANIVRSDMGIFAGGLAMAVVARYV